MFEGVRFAAGPGERLSLTFSITQTSSAMAQEAHDDHLVLALAVQQIGQSEEQLLATRADGRLLLVLTTQRDARETVEALPGCRVGVALPPRHVRGHLRHVRIDVVGIPHRWYARNVSDASIVSTSQADVRLALPLAPSATVRSGRCPISIELRSAALQRGYTAIRAELVMSEMGKLELRPTDIRGGRGMTTIYPI